MTNYKLGDKLYALTSRGKIKVWWATVDGDTLSMHRCTNLDGKVITLSETLAEGKNIGKTNETTKEDQALLEAESKYRAKLRTGYTTAIPKEGERPLLNALGYLKPMLAKASTSDKWKYPLRWQPKLDGHRCMMVGTPTGNLLYSRGGKLIETMGHIATSIKLDPGEYLDGELYIHGMELNDIGSLINKYRAIYSKQVKLIVYDAPHLSTSFKHRQKFYEQKLKHPTRNNWNFDQWIDRIENSNEHIIPIHTKICTIETEVKVLTATALGHGFEGGIVRNADMKYRAGARSSDLIKIKEFDEGEWEISDITEGKRYTLGGVDLPQAKFHLALADGQTFDVAAPGTKEKKAYYWENRIKYIGKLCTVKHSAFTAYGIPWHPVGVRIRKDI
jgi:ATP-dependent DNA ligase